MLHPYFREFLLSHSHIYCDLNVLVCKVVACSEVRLT